MPKILVNYKYNKKTDTYSLISGDVVYADMPVAVMDLGAEYESILVVPIQNENTVVDKEEYLSYNKLFKLLIDKDGNVSENPKGMPIYLPKGTDVNKLKFINGQLVLVEDEENNKEGE